MGEFKVTKNNKKKQKNKNKKKEDSSLVEKLNEPQVKSALVN
jgi:hypothetical protein